MCEKVVFERVVCENVCVWVAWRWWKRDCMKENVVWKRNKGPDSSTWQFLPMGHKREAKTEGERLQRHEMVKGMYETLACARVACMCLFVCIM